MIGGGCHVMRGAIGCSDSEEENCLGGIESVRMDEKGGGEIG